MKIIVDISVGLAAQVMQAIERANANSTGNTHGELNPEVVVEMLLQDVAMTVTRPGSWEGVNMAQVLASHGYEV